MIKIQTKSRPINNKLSNLRKSGFLPAVFYGLGKKSTPISISEKDFQKIWKQAGESTPVTLETPEGNIDTLIHEVQFDPVTSAPIHADFLVIDINKAVQVKIPLEFVGDSEAVKNGGILVKVLHELEVLGLPKDLPHKIQVDISKLAGVDDVVLVKDLNLPAAVKAVAKPEEIVASISEQEEEKEEAAAPIDLSAIEVEKKGKKEEGAEGAAAEAGAGAKAAETPKKAEKK